MSSIADRVSYFLDCLGKYSSKRHFICGNCGSSQFETVDRKYVVTSLRRCQHCRILYRVPTTTHQENDDFYNEKYEEGFTTSTPTDDKLKTLIETKFSNSEKDYHRYIYSLQKLGIKAGDRIFDFGCSWGYGSYQLSGCGYEVNSFEVSRNRAAFAREKLGVNIVEDIKCFLENQNNKNCFDCFFSSHVLEHVPSPSETLRLGQTLVRNGGLIVAITPNGTAAYRQKNPVSWHRVWGEKHGYLLDDVFYRSYFQTCPMLICSLPVGDAEAAGFLAGQRIVQNDLDGPELLVAARI